MCLIVIAHAVSDAAPLVIAANRDEAHDRPSLAAAWWDDAPGVIGGRDLRAGGSWLAITRGGRFAAVTNVRDGRAVAAGAPSRGALVREFVISHDAPLAYVERIAMHGGDYAGFHLIAGEAGRDIAHYTNDGGEPHLIERGTIFAISNAPHGESWPKTERAAAAMRAALQSGDPATSLMTFLTTPIGGDRRDEIFIIDPVYGTRAATVIVVDAAGKLRFDERTFGRGDVPR
ncbi:MAG: hypothetical protein JWO97_2590 [Acidobacteria bacterium]|nr:hypothetical protein [Acidobacteriota bacterium]